MVLDNDRWICAEVPFVHHIHVLNFILHIARSFQYWISRAPNAQIKSKSIAATRRKKQSSKPRKHDHIKGSIDEKMVKEGSHTRIEQPTRSNRTSSALSATRALVALRCSTERETLEWMIRAAKQAQWASRLWQVVVETQGDDDEDRRSTRIVRRRCRLQRSSLHVGLTRSFVCSFVPPSVVSLQSRSPCHNDEWGHSFIVIFGCVVDQFEKTHNTTVYKIDLMVVIFWSAGMIFDGLLFIYLFIVLIIVLKNILKFWWMYFGTSQFYQK